MTKNPKAPWRVYMEETVSSFSKRFKAKFIRGVKEHGGNLHMKPAIEMIEWSLDEVIDLVSYQSVLRSHLNTIQQIADDALNSKTVFRKPEEYREALEQISNILRVGNPQGEPQKGD